MKLKMKQCQRCGHSYTEDLFYDLETPNFIFSLCTDCAIDTETEMEEQLKKIRKEQNLK